MRHWVLPCHSHWHLSLQQNWCNIFCLLEWTWKVEMAWGMANPRPPRCAAGSLCPGLLSDSPNQLMTIFTGVGVLPGLGSSRYGNGEGRGYGDNMAANTVSVHSWIQLPTNKWKLVDANERFVRGFLSHLPPLPCGVVLALAPKELRWLMPLSPDLLAGMLHPSL